MEIIKITNAKSDLFIKGIFYAPLFDREIKINIDPDVDMKYAEMCAEHFNNLSEKMVDEFCEMAINYCEFMREGWADFGYDDIVAEINKAIPNRLKGREVLKFISDPQMYIELPEENIPGYSITSDCIWEPEHQLEWIIKGNRNLYVGEVRGLNAWDNESEYECDY